MLTVPAEDAELNLMVEALFSKITWHRSHSSKNIELNSIRDTRLSTVVDDSSNTIVASSKRTLFVWASLIDCEYKSEFRIAMAMNGINLLNI